MIRTSKKYIKLETLMIMMIDRNITFVNPFSGFDVFKATNTGYNIDGDDLFRLFAIKYKDRFVGREIPCIGKKYINHLIPNTVGIINSEDDQINYIYKFIYNQIVCFLEENKDNYIRIMNALTEHYNPIENYNMVEMSGSASKVSDTKSTPGTITANTKVAPYNDDNQDLHQTVTSATQSTAGYSDATQTMQWAAGDVFGVTPAGNSVAMSKHTRSGNIGVTTSQQMIDQELKLRADSIVDEFLMRASDTCLLCEWY